MRLAAKDRKPGMRVVLSNPDRGYTISESNPAVGSRYFCEGEIAKEPTAQGIRVKWDNGHYNMYKDYELTVIDINVVSIW